MSIVRMVRRHRFRLAMVFFALAAVLLTAGIAAACPTCKDGMASNDPEHAHMVKGYFYSILFMMGMPYLLLTSFGLYMYREVRKARPRRVQTSSRRGAKETTRPRYGRRAGQRGSRARVGRSVKAAISATNFSRLVLIATLGRKLVGPRRVEI